MKIKLYLRTYIFYSRVISAGRKKWVFTGYCLKTTAVKTSIFHNLIYKFIEFEYNFKEYVLN